MTEHFGRGQVVGWPPVRYYRRHALTKPSEMFVKVNMDGIAVGRKVDLNAYSSYERLLQGLEEMFQPTAGKIYYMYGSLSSGCLVIYVMVLVYGMLTILMFSLCWCIFEGDTVLPQMVVLLMIPYQTH